MGHKLQMEPVCCERVWMSLPWDIENSFMDLSLEPVARRLEDIMQKQSKMSEWSVFIVELKAKEMAEREGSWRLVEEEVVEEEGFMGFFKGWKPCKG